MRKSALGVLLGVLMCSSAANAQEQRGSIEGVVRDAQGAVVPGVVVEARNAAGVTVSAVTDAAGTYRFPSLPPGTFAVKAALAGFRPQEYERVDVLLGQIKRVDFTLAVGGVAEAVQVTAESPLVDVRQSARATSIRDELLELIPKGRDFSTLVTQAPGANYENRLGGISIDGSSASENRFIVDGRASGHRPAVESPMINRCFVCFATFRGGSGTCTYKKSRF